MEIMKSKKSRIVALCILFVLPISGGCMSFFKDVANIATKGGDVVTFSAVEGVVTYEGKPVANAKIIRRVEDKDNNSEDDFATTDEKGYFSMPSRYGNSDSVFQEVFAWQYMYVELEGEQKRIWYHVKHVKDEHGELEGTPIFLLCELTNEKRIWEPSPYGRRVISICDLKDFQGIDVNKELDND